MASVQKRLYIGGLFDGIKESDLKERFQQFGQIDSINIKGRKNEQGETVKTFAFIHMKTTEENLKKCISIFSKSKWKGHQVVVQTAKEDFISRLQQERNSANIPDVIPEKKTKTNSELEKHLCDAGVKDFNKRGAVPGTGIPGERNWVVGKFGRVLPIVHVRRKDKKKIMKYDPSKHTHGLKRFQDGADNDENDNELTWELQERQDENYKKRKGEFEEREIKKGRLSKSQDGSLENRANEISTSKDARDESEVKKGNHSSNHGNNNKISKDVDNLYIVQEDSSDEEIVFTNIRQKMKTSESAAKYKDLSPKRTSLNDFYDSDHFIDGDEDFFDRLDADKTLKQKLEVMSSKSHEKMRSSALEDEDGVMEVVSETFTPKSYLIYENKQGPGTMKSDKLRTKVSKKVDIKTLGSCDDSGNDSSGSADTDDICTVTKKSFLVDVMSTSEKKKKKTKLDSMSTVKKTPVKPFMDNEEKKSETKKNKKILASMPTPTTCEEQIKVNSKMDIVDENNKTSTRKVDTETKKRSKKRKSEKIDGNKLKSEKTAKTLDSSRAKCDTSTILNNNEHGRNTDSGTCDSLVDHTKILDKTEQNISKLPLTLKGLTTTPGWAADVELPKQKPSIMDFYDSDDFVDEDDDLFDRLDVDKSLKQRLEVMSSLKSNEKKKTSEDVALEVVSEKYTPKYRYRLFFGSTEGSEIKTDKTRTRTSTEGDIKKQGFLIDSGDDSTGSADTDDICTVADTPRMVLFNMDEVMSTSKKKPKKKQIDSVATDQSFQNTPVKVIGNHEGKKSETKKKKKMGVSMETPTVCEQQVKVKSDKDKYDSDEKSASVAANAVEIKSKKLTKERKSKNFELLDSDCEQQNDNSVKTSIMKDSSKNCESRNQVKETEENMSILDCEKSAHKSEVKQSTKVNKAKKVRKPAAVRKMEAKLKIKHKNDNEKRLESIREKQRSTQKQKSAIQDALASVDSNKKMGQYIVFDSDEESESESEPQPQPQPQPESESESESTGTIDLKDTDAVSAGDAEDLKKTKKTKDALTLFDSDSSSNDDDDDDDDSDEDRFQIKPQFEGKSGGKLMSLQSRFGMDERFKIDERFQESDEEDKSEKMKNKEDSDSDATENEDYDLVKEKASQLSILQDIVGTKALLKFSAKSKGSFKDMASLHFDPTRKDHSEFETKIKDERLKKKDKKSEKKKDEEDPPEVTKDKYFEVSEEIKDGFSAEKPFSFSFLPDDGQQTGDKMETEYTTSSVSKSPWQPKLFRYDSTDEEIEEDDPIDETVSKQHSNETEDKSQNVEDKTSRPTFFFHLNDPRLIEGPKLFCRPSNETEITKKWKETIPLIQEDYRKRHQDALRRIKKAAKQRRGKKW